MIFKVCHLLSEDRVCEAQEFITITLNKLLTEEKFSLVDLILMLFLKNKTIPDYIYCQLLDLTKDYRDKLPTREKIENLMKVCE